MSVDTVRLVYVVHEFPARTQTFVEREVVALRDLGVSVEIYALHRGKSDFDTLSMNYWKSLPVLGRLFHRLPDIFREVSARSDNLQECLRQLYSVARGASLASNLLDDPEPVHLHSHFIARSTDVANYAALLCKGRVTQSGTGHAAEVLSPLSSSLLARRLECLDVAVGASEIVSSRISEVTGRSTSVVHCGVMSLPPLRKLEKPVARPTRVLTVARAVEKKALDVIIRSAEGLQQRGVAVEWKVVGDGPLLPQLRVLAEALPGRPVTMVGHLEQAEVSALMGKWADLFVLAPRQAASGDVDGIPVVLMEAMSNSLPIISSPVGGIKELVRHGETGVLVPPDDHKALSIAVEQVFDDGDQVAHTTQMAWRLISTQFRASEEAAALYGIIMRTLQAVYNQSGRSKNTALHNATRHSRKPQSRAIDW